MSDWEMKQLQNQLDRLEKKLEYQHEKIHKESTSRFIWLMAISNVLFWLFIFQIGLKHDFNTLILKQKSDAKITNITQ